MRVVLFLSLAAVAVTVTSCSDPPDEICEDGNDNDGDGLLDSLDIDDCAPICGDGLLNNKEDGHEECDDGNPVNGDGCNTSCQIEDGGAGGAGGSGGGSGGAGGAGAAGGEGGAGGGGGAGGAGGAGGGGGGPTCMSVDFDGAGTAALNAPDNAAYDFAGSFTIEAWVKVEGAPSLNISLVAGQVVDDMTLSLSSYALGINSSLAPVFSVTDAIGTSVTVGSALTLDTWVHLAGVADGTNATLYVNGTQASQLPAGFAVAGDGLDIGHSKANFASNYQLNGLIDELRLSDVARYAGTFTPEKTFAADIDTVGLFHLDENLAGSTPDASATANAAVVTGTVTFVADCP